MRTEIAERTSVRGLGELVVHRDGDEWIMGNTANNTFIAVPRVAVDAVRLLSSGSSAAQVQSRLFERYGEHFDVATFVDDLADCGLVDSARAKPVPQKVSFPRLESKHVRWIVSEPAAIVIGSVVVAGGTTAVLTPHVIPHYSDLLWSRYVGLVLLGNAAIGWSLAMLHEMAHLLTARAFGAPARITLSTRLQFVVAQTDVTAMWTRLRPQRVLVYVSGMLLDLSIAATALMGRAVLDPNGALFQLCGAVALIALIPISTQFLVFMRTDMYYVLQDVLRCRNLYADGSEYVAWLSRRALRRGRKNDPSAELPLHERRGVRVYAVVLALGTVACVGVALLVSIPAAITFLSRMVQQLDDGAALVRADSLLAIVLTLTLFAVWCVAWWKRHGPRVRQRIAPA